MTTTLTRKQAKARTAATIARVARTNSNTNFPQLRPGSVIYDDCWNGPAIVVSREGDRVHIVTGMGYVTKDVEDLDFREIPEPGSPLDTLADHIFSGFPLSPETLPFAKQKTQSLPILTSAEGEAFRLELLNVLRLDAENDWSVADVTTEINTIQKDRAEEYKEHKAFREQIMDALGMNRTGHDTGDERSTLAILSRIKELRTGGAVNATATTSPIEAPTPRENTIPLDLRRFHSMAVELEHMFYGALAGDQDNGWKVAIVFDGENLPHKVLDKGDYDELTNNLDDVRWRAEIFIEYAMTAQVRAKLAKPKA